MRYKVQHFLKEIQNMENSNGKEINIFDQGILVNLSIGRWRGSKKLEARDINKYDSEIPANCKLGVKKQVSKNAFSEFTTIKNRAEKLLQQYALPFPIRAVYFIPNNYIERVVNDLRNCQNEYDDMSDKFVADKYDDEMNLIKETYPNQFSSWDYPDKTSLRNKFYFRYQVFKMDMGNGNFLSEDEILQQRANMKSQLSEFAEMYGVALRKEILEFAGRLSEKFNKGEVFQQKSIDNVLGFCDRFDKGLNFLNDKGVSKAVVQLKLILKGNDNAEELRDDDNARQQLGTEIKKVVSSIEEEMKSINKSAQEYGRKLVF
jgi:hypothetical protein